MLICHILISKFQMWWNTVIESFRCDETQLLKVSDVLKHLSKVSDEIFSYIYVNFQMWWNTYQKFQMCWNTYRKFQMWWNAYRKFQMWWNTVIESFRCDETQLSKVSDVMKHSYRKFQMWWNTVIESFRCDETLIESFRWDLFLHLSKFSDVVNHETHIKVSDVLKHLPKVSDVMERLSKVSNVMKHLSKFSDVMKHSSNVSDGMKRLSKVSIQGIWVFRIASWRGPEGLLNISSLLQLNRLRKTFRNPTNKCIALLN